MTTVAEATAAEQSAAAVALEAGLTQLSEQQNVPFTLYNKVALSQDGFVFWVATSQAMKVTGSLHYSTDRLQDQDQTVASNHVLLSVNQEITAFNTVAPNSMWIGSWPTGTDGSGPPLQVVFSSRGFLYGPAQVWHYAGLAVYSALSAQIVQSEADLPAGPIVSNSLPIWLSMNSYTNGQGQITTIPVYPSFLVPDNITPPYVVAHIEPGSTTAIQPYMIIGPWPGTTIANSGTAPLHELPSSQLMRDEVELTLYGFTNATVIAYLAQLIDNSINLATFGFANDPAIRDEKRTQVELAAIAQKKSIHVSANYYQGTADAIARRLILNAQVGAYFIQQTGWVYASGSLLQPAGSLSGSGTGYAYGPGAFTQPAAHLSGVGSG